MVLKAIAGGDNIPPEPIWSTIYPDKADRASAAAHWAAIVREMLSECTLTPANGPAIRRLTEFQVQYEVAARHVAENGPLLPGESAKIGQWNPYWAAMRHASEEIRQIEGMLGLTPTTRGRATKVKREKQTSRASDNYLKSVS